MGARILDGKSIAADLRAEIAATVAAVKAEAGWVPGLGVVLVGDDPASRSYVSAKEKACALDVVPAAAAVGEAIRLSNAAKKPVVIADTQDNPGGGGHGTGPGRDRDVPRRHRPPGRPGQAYRP